jgi:hypothetical protein
MLRNVGSFINELKVTIDQNVHYFSLVLDESPEYQIKEEDSIFPEPCSEDRCNNIINKTPQSMVEFLELKDIYEKVQSRAGGGSHQRVASGLINIKATSEGQLCGMNVFVQRMPEAAALCGDVNGRIPLEVNHEDYFKNQVCTRRYKDWMLNMYSQLTTKICKFLIK